MVRTVAVAVVALVAGVGLGLAKDAGAAQPRPVLDSVTTKTPASCLVALEDAWKTLNPIPGDGDHRSEFDTTYQDCLNAN